MKDVVEYYARNHWKSQSKKQREKYLAALVEESAALESRGVMAFRSALNIKGTLERNFKFRPFQADDRPIKSPGQKTEAFIRYLTSVFSYCRL